MDLTNKKIFIFLQRNWGRKVGFPIAKKFSKEGASLGALTFQKDYHQTYLESDLKFDWIMSHDDIINNPKLFLKDDEISIKEICENLKIKSIWPYVQSLREHVKSYKEKFFFGSYKQNISDENILLYVKSVYKLLVKIDREFSPEIFILPNFVGLVHIFTYLFCKVKNIKIFAYSSAPVKGKSIFIKDFYDSTGIFFEKLEKYNSKNELPSNEEEINKFLKNELLKINSDNNKIAYELKIFDNTKKLIIKIFKSIIKKKEVHHLEKSKLFGVYLDNLPIKYLIRDYFAYILNFLKTKKIKFYKLKDVENFAYMPLQFQPEANIDVTSHSFNNQIETARQIAMNLPGDMTLVVKDHPEMFGLRSYKYLEKILKTPNVKLINSSYKGTYVIKKSKLLIAPTGTSFFEAALIKKPGLILGNLGTSIVLPNVLKINSYEEIPDKVNEIINLSKGWKDDYTKKLKIIIGCSFENCFDYDDEYSKLWLSSYSSDESINHIYNEFKKEVIRLTNN